MLTVSTWIARLGEVRKYRPKPKSDRYHHGNLRNELVATAVSIIERDGPEALTLRAVAKRLRVSQTAPYRHFASKEQMLVAVAAEGFHALLNQMRERQAQVGADPMRWYVEMGVTYLTFALSQRAHFRVMYATRPSEFSGGAVAEAGRLAFKLLVDSVVACQEAGKARAGDPSIIAVKAWGYVHGLTCLFIEGLLPRRLQEEAVAELVRQMPVFLDAGVVSEVEARPPPVEGKG
jgi:AcrR family transcriptional regulator